MWILVDKHNPAQLCIFITVTNLTIILEFDSHFVGKNPILKIPNDQNHGWYPLFDPYEFAARTVWRRWFFSFGGKDRIVQVNGNNGSRK